MQNNAKHSSEKAFREMSHEYHNWHSLSLVIVPIYILSKWMNSFELQWRWRKSILCTCRTRSMKIEITFNINHKVNFQWETWSIMSDKFKLFHIKNILNSKKEVNSKTQRAKLESIHLVTGNILLSSSHVTNWNNGVLLWEILLN